MSCELEGVGLGWRPETASHFSSHDAPAFAEALVETDENGSASSKWAQLCARGTPVVLHGVSLGLGDPGGLAPHRLDRLARCAERVGAPMVSEHIAFVRAADTEVGHLTAVPRCSAMLELLIERVSYACRVLPVPLALENIASYIEWPESDMDEASFLGTLLAETPAKLLLDLSNLYANAVNHGRDALDDLARLPIDKIAYVHVAGGVADGELYHDTHAHPLPTPVMSLVEWLAPRYEARTGRRLPVMLERDDRFPSFDELANELGDLRRAVGVSAEHADTKRGASAPAVHAVSRIVGTASRAALEQRQYLLARALRHDEPAPTGFDARRVEVAAARLAAKRKRGEERWRQRRAEQHAREASLAALSHLFGASWPVRARRRLTGWLSGGGKRC